MALHLDVELICSVCGSKLKVESCNDLIVHVPPCDKCLYAEYNRGYDEGDENYDLRVDANAQA